MTKVVYSNHYNMGLLGLERHHPFDVRKFGRAWKALGTSLGPRLSNHHIPTDRPATDDELLAVHTPEHLQRMGDSVEVAKAVELPILKWIPAPLIAVGLLTPMRWAVRGTVLAAQQALACGSAVNLGGGFHHAKPDQAEGFCIFSDIALTVSQLRRDRLLAPESRIVYIDLDAHQGNGVCHHFLEDSRVFIFDMFNAQVYPRDPVARSRIDCAIPLEIGCPGSQYLDLLHQRLPGFLDALGTSQPIALAIYTAGTDVVTGDPVGLLELSPEEVRARDRDVLAELRNRGIPSLMVLGGGYTQDSYQLVADTVGELLENSGA